jgi:hypothetical protein
VELFAEKVAKVRANMSGALSLTVTRFRPDVSFRTFKLLSSADVVNAIIPLPDKCSAVGAIPKCVLKRTSHVVAPFIAALFSRSIVAGCFPAGFKVACVTPILEKLELDSVDWSSYRPISNLSVVSKLIERLVVSQLLDYLTSAKLLPPFQSHFRPGHLIETAVLHVLSHLLSAVD